MESFKKNIIYLSLIYLNILFIIKITEKCFKINNVSYMYLTILFIISVIIYYINSFFINNTFYKFLIIICIVIILILLFYYNKQYFQGILLKNMNYIMDLNNNIYNRQQTDFYKFRLLSAFIIPILTFFTLWCIDKIFFNFILLFNFCIIIFFWYYGYKTIIKEYTFYYILISSVTYFVSTYIRNVEETKNKGLNIYVAYNTIILYAIVLAMILSSVQLLLPKEIEGRYDNKKVNKFIDKFSIRKVDVEHKYNIGYSGYDNTSKKLGGSISISNREAFKVKGDRPYYLRGTSKEYYDGFSWDNLQDNFQSVSYKNTFLKPKAGNLFSIIRDSKLDYLIIYPTYIRTATFFTPMYTRRIETKGKKAFYNKDNNFISNNLIEKEYIIEFYNDNFKYSLINQDEDKRDKIKEIMDYGYKRMLSLEKEKFKEYDIYLQIPENIPKRVYSLVEDITKGEKNPGGKVFKIYDYLQKNFNYSLQVSEVPKGKEFVDYFLFTEKKGYCTYFATAATIMCRIAGIPARYVEGFNMTYDKDINGLFIVSDKNAHAWTEILLDPLSNNWSIFDAVPSAPLQIEREEHRETKNESHEITKSNENYKKDIENIKENNIREQHEESRMKNNYIYLIVFAMISSLIIIRIIVIIIKRKKIIKSQSIIPLYLYMVERLKVLNISKMENEGDKEFVKRIEDVVLKLKMNEIVEYVYEEFYGNSHKLLDINKKKELYNFIENYIKNIQGISRYYFTKFITI